MKTLTLLLTLTFAIVLGKAQAQDSLATQYDGFEVSFPQPPSYDTQTYHTDVADIKIHTFQTFVEDLDTPYYCILVYADFPSDPKDPPSKKELAAFFKGSRTGYLNQVKGEILSEESFKIKKYEGKDIRILIEDGATILHVKMLLVKNRVYYIQTRIGKENERYEVLSKFIDSFKIIE